MQRGSMFDMLAIILILLVLVISWFFAASFFSSIQTAYINAQNATGGMTAVEAAAFNGGALGLNIFLDFGIPFIMVLSMLGALLFAWMIPTSRIFLPIALLLYLIFAYLGATSSNICQTFLTSAGISATANLHPIPVAICNNFPLILGLFGVLLLVVLYARGGASEGGVP